MSASPRHASIRALLRVCEAAYRARAALTPGESPVVRLAGALEGLPLCREDGWRELLAPPLPASLARVLDAAEAPPPAPPGEEAARHLAPRAAPAAAGFRERSGPTVARPARAAAVRMLLEHGAEPGGRAVPGDDAAAPAVRRVVGPTLGGAPRARPAAAAEVERWRGRLAARAGVAALARPVRVSVPELGVRSVFGAAAGEAGIHAGERKAAPAAPTGPLDDGLGAVLARIERRHPRPATPRRPSAVRESVPAEEAAGAASSPVFSGAPVPAGGRSAPEPVIPSEVRGLRRLAALAVPVSGPPAGGVPLVEPLRRASPAPEAGRGSEAGQPAVDLEERLAAILRRAAERAGIDPGEPSL